MHEPTRKNYSFPLYFPVFLATLTLVLFFFLATSFHNYEIAVTRSWLAQRLMRELPAVQGGVVAAADRDTATGAEPTDGRAGSDFVSRLRLLLDGGCYAGRCLPPLAESEFRLLLKSLLPGARGGGNGAGFPDRKERLAHLAAALVLEAAEQVHRCWLLFFFLALLLVLLFFSLLLFFRYCRHCGEEFEMRSRESWLQAELLRKWPEAIILIDRRLTVKLLSRRAESLLAGESGYQGTLCFDRFCREQALLTSIRRVFAELGTPGGERLPLEPERFSLQNPIAGTGSGVEVVGEWYGLTLDGEAFLLGRLHEASASLAELSGTFTSRYLQEMTEKFFTVQDEERRLLADELHDGLCQALAVLKMQVAGIERRLEEGELKNECVNVRRYVAQIIEDVRRLSHDLSPVILDDLGLSEALVHLVGSFTATHDIQVVTEVPQIDEYFSESQARNIYRIVQEAINNVGKHAQASMMSLEVKIGSDSIVFTIRDDGIGFESGKFKIEPGRAGIGLASMAQRVALLGGRFSIASRPGRGTEVCFSLPVTVRPERETFPAEK